MRAVRLVGAIGAVVYTIGFFVAGSIPGGGEPEAGDFEEFYVTDDNTATALIGAVLLTLGAIALLWFFHTLRAAMAGTDAGFGRACAAIGLALIAGSGAILAGPSAVQVVSDGEFVGEQIAHTFAQAGYGLMLVPGALFLGAAVVVLSLVGRRAGVLLPWAAIAGIVAGALQVVSFLWIPALLIPLWVLVTSLAGLRLGGDRAAATA